MRSVKQNQRPEQITFTRFSVLGFSPYREHLEAKGTRSKHTENTTYLLKNNSKYILEQLLKTISLAPLQVDVTVQQILPTCQRGSN